MGNGGGPTGTRLLLGSGRCVKIWVSKSAVEQMTSLGREFAPLETGGILLGWTDGPDRIVTGIIGAGPRAMHGRQAFIPDHRWQMEALHDAFAQSSGDLNYIGDWHTHPVGPTIMSSEDERTLRRIGRRITAPAMIIVDPSRAPAEIASWTLESSGWFARSVQPLEPRYFQPLPNWPTYFR